MNKLLPMQAVPVLTIEVNFYQKKKKEIQGK